LLHLDGQVHPDTHAIPMGNYVIRVGNYVIVSPSRLGNYKVADKAGHLRCHGPRCADCSGLSEQVVRDLSGHAEQERGERGPAGEPSGPVTD
jgi:hypothetical protein